MHPDLHGQIGALEHAIGDPRGGLPDEVFRFVSRITPLVNVDLFIQDERTRTLLIWRDDNFYGPGWHVPGGIVRFKETVADRLQACAREELGAEIRFDPSPFLVSEVIGAEKTRGHFVSLLFRCRLLSPPDERLRAASDVPSSGQWRWHDRCPANLLEEQRHYARLL